MYALCDVVSYGSSHDNAEERFDALMTWAGGAQEESEECTVWIDQVPSNCVAADTRDPRASADSLLLRLVQVCLNQSGVPQAVLCLPFFIAGCRKFLAFVGPTFSSRLWCLLELFFFLKTNRSLTDALVVCGACDISP